MSEESPLVQPELVYTLRDLAQPTITPRKDRPDYEFSFDEYVSGVAKVFDTYRLLP